MITPRSATLRCLAAAAMVGATLPMAAGPAHADDATYTGFSTTTAASPVKVEVYEPTVPIPASPQFELELGYTTVEADSSSSHGRASYLWPGDPVGEGAKTFLEQLGVPEQVAANGYPFQVNSTSPSGEPGAKDEPFPGMVLRTSAAPERTSAEAGYSTDCQVQPAGGDGAGGGDGGGGGLPGVPSPPPLPTAPVAAGGSQTQSAKSQRAAEKSACPFPAELAALVDVGGYESTSSSANTADLVTTTARAAVSDVRLLGGVITISDAHARSLATSDGDRGRPAGRAGYGTLAIAGQEFTIGPDGIEARGQHRAIPGLPDEPAKALAQLGVRIVVPEPAYSREGAKATSEVAALRVDIDTHQLRSRLDSVPFDDIVGAVPDQAGELKSLLGAAVHLSPRFVITLGDAVSAADTVQGLEFPTTPVTGGGTPAAGAGGSGVPAGGVSPSAPTAGAPGASTPPAAAGTLDDAAPMSAGLPPLGSVPGVLLYGGVGLAAAAGAWLRKLGMLTLGGAGTCTHGLDSGLPDLRKA